ncbi:MAG: hypothetical protein R3E79_18320 [Caldilineaceae bacterium]
MTSTDFALHLHQPFELQFNPLLTMWLALDAVQDATPMTPQPQLTNEGESFSVIFHGPQQPVLPARTYQLSHPSLGRFNLLLTPFERRQTGMRYKAVVSTPC